MQLCKDGATGTASVLLLKVLLVGQARKLCALPQETYNAVNVGVHVMGVVINGLLVQFDFSAWCYGGWARLCACLQIVRLCARLFAV